MNLLVVVALLSGLSAVFAILAVVLQLRTQRIARAALDREDSWTPPSPPQ